MPELSPVDPDAIGSLPVQIDERFELRCTPVQLFESFARAEDWKAWLGLHVNWTTPPPCGPGTKRTVRIGPVEADEVFTRWIDGEEMSFYLSRSSGRGMRQFAERWRVTPQEQGCTLRWQVGIRPSVAGRLLMPVIRRALVLAVRRGIPKLDALARGEREARR